MEIGDDPGFIVVCYCDHGAEVESKNEASIDTQLEESIDEMSEAMIDKAVEAPIDSDPVNEIDDFSEGSINSWKNDYYQSSFAIETATPSKRKISAMDTDEYDEHYIEEEIIEYRGFAMEEAGVLKISHETRGNIDRRKPQTIDRYSSRDKVRCQSRR